MKKKSILNQKNLVYLVPPAIVAIVVLAVYFIKGIYPFGDLTVIYTDMAQGYIPFCYHLYDVFMNGKSLLWDPLLGNGSNMFGVEAFTGMFSPISWLVIFSSREGIPYFASILLLVRMALMAAMAFLFFKNVFKDTKLFWQVALSVVYAFSGYVLILYTNTMWLDCAILFPLLMLMFKILLDREKIIGFILVLTASLIVCFYISFMVLLFVLFGGGVVILFYLDKTKRKKAVFHLGVATLTSLLLSSVVIIPAYLQSSGSARAAGFDYFNILKTQMISISYKGQYFIFAAIALVIVVKLAMHYKKDKKAVTAFGLLLALTTSQIVVESINLIWHTGSYAHFPMRFAFIPTLLLLAGAAYYFSKKNVLPLFKNDITQIGFGVLAAGTYVLAV
ncbi:MAG: YfhO family protein, partial [Clostridia bacterium]